MDQELVDAAALCAGQTLRVHSHSSDSAAFFRVKWRHGRHVESMTSYRNDAHLLEEHSCRISSRSDLKRQSLRLFLKRSVAPNKKNKMSSDMGSVPEPQKNNSIVELMSTWDNWACKAGDGRHALSVQSGWRRTRASNSRRRSKWTDRQASDQWSGCPQAPKDGKNTHQTSTVARTQTPRFYQSQKYTQYRGTYILPPDKHHIYLIL